MKELKVKQDRIALRPEDAGKLDGWLIQVSNSYPGISLTRSSLVCWLIGEFPEVLRASDKKQIKSLFFDEVKQAQWIVQQLKAAKERGESKSLVDFLRSSKESNLSPIKQDTEEDSND